MILWLGGIRQISPGMRAVLQGLLHKHGIAGSQVMLNSLHFKTPGISEHSPKKLPDKSQILKARKNLEDDCKILRPKVIVVNDEDTLRIITGEKYTLATTRGSLYWFNSIPCIVLDNFSTIRYRKYGKFVFELDLAKVARWAKGEQKNEAAFSYVLCKTVDDVVEQTTKAASSAMVATDRETAGGFITCTAYTYATGNGSLISFTIPFFNPHTENGCYWKTEAEEVEVHNLLRKLNVSKVIKCFQNGTYDCAYDILYGMESNNYLVDTANLSHSIWCELPKKLHQLASYFVDHYTYWKDENKGAKEEDGFYKSIDNLERYWRYNALDSYYTFLSADTLLAKIVSLPYALRNYSSEFSLSVGPCLVASLTGIKVERQRHSKLSMDQWKSSQEGAEDLRRLSGEVGYNINSTSDNAWLLYDVLGAKATRLQKMGSKYGKRSTDEKVLSLMKEQLNFFVSHAIDRILRAKKPTTWLSKYGKFNELTYHGRFLSWHNAAGTETFRFNSGGSQFWTGTNGQNWQPYTQEMLVADPDYVLVDCDYSASDDWFIAYESEDPDKIAILNSGKDVHSYHASVFFKRPYEEIIAGKKSSAPWVVDAIKGCRQVSKKVAHGKNFRMQPTMMYNLMGRDAAVATAKALGYKNAEGMTDKELIGMCAMLCDVYDHPRTGMYKRIRPWQDESTQELKDNDGLYTNCFGITRKFLGNPDDHDTQRELSAQAGQSGTSGNINRALRKIFYSGLVDGKLSLFVLQVHDSLKFLIHKSALARVIPQIKIIMEEKITIKERIFFVPVNIEVGLTDGKKMLPWRDDLTYEEIRAHEEKIYGEKFPKGNAALLKQLGDLDFDAVGLSSLDEELSHIGNEEDATVATDDEEPELAEGVE